MLLYNLLYINITIGIIHADIKPDNILLSSKDLSSAEIRLADFGLAELKVEENIRIGETSLAETKHDRGTPIYCAPEQLYDPFVLDEQSLTVAKPSEKTDIVSIYK